MELFTFQNLNFTYPRADSPALKDISFGVSQGEFIILAGPSGCGKSTLLRQMKSCLAPKGEKTGSILLEGRPLESFSHREQAGAIGFVLQNPENQVVTNKVWSELAFGLESLHLTQAEIRRRVAEIAAFFGIENWFYKEVAELSGGQKQLLSLASVMAMQPKVLILDEPTAQLDPIAATEFFSLLGRIHRELGTTVILSEHRLEEAFPYAGRILVMDGGRLVANGVAEEIALALKQQKSPLFGAMPAAMQIWAGVETGLRCPMTVAQGREFLKDRAAEQPLSPLPPAKLPQPGAPVLEGKGLWFRYGKNQPDIVRNMDIALHRGELLAVLGGNGSGKTTTVRLLAALETPYRGKVVSRGTIGLLPQNPQTLFIKDTLREDLQQVCPEEDPRFAKTVALCGLTSLLDRHPYDVSGGEMQRAALAKVLLSSPDILLLDEPTKGFDAGFQKVFGAILKQLCAQGVSVLLVSHDVAFCAEYASRCCLCFDGCMVAQGTPREFFSGSTFYTTPASRIARQTEPKAVTVADVVAICGGTPEAEMPDPPDLPLPPAPPAAPKARLPLWRKLLAWVFGAASLALAVFCFARTNVAQLFSMGRINARGYRTLGVYALLIFCLLGLFFCLGNSGKKAPVPRKASWKARLGSVLCLLAIPLTIYIGIFPLEGEHYNLIALFLLLECIAPFVLLFEGRKPQPRELVTIAVLCALGVAGRSAFAMLPQFKPVLALTILAGASLGPQQGFLVGATTMLSSNMLFSQGPWTPWQMFAMGLCGFLSGLLLRGRSPGSLALSIFGAITAVVVYGGIMNFSSAVTWNAQSLTVPVVAGYFVTGLPMDLVHGAATAAFLALMGAPMLKKLERLQEKYPIYQ